MILLDTSGLFAALSPDERHHTKCAHVLANTSPPYVLSPLVLAEIDYLLLKFQGVRGEIPFLDEIAHGVYELAQFTAADVVVAMTVIEQYRSLGIGLADASIIVLAERYKTYDILTLDERHFRAVRPLSGRRSFHLLPADS